MSSLFTRQHHGRVGTRGFGVAETLPPQTNLLSHWDAASAYVTQSAGIVSQWNDRKGSNHLTQSDVTKRPIWTSGLLGSRAGITGDGVNDSLACDFTAAVPCSIYFVFKRLAAGTESHGIWSGRNDNNVYGRIAGTQEVKILGTNAALYVALNTWAIGGFALGATTTRYKLNGAASTLDNNGVGSVSLAGFVAFARNAGLYPVNVTFAEVLFYNGIQHSDSEMTAVHTALNTRNVVY